MIKLHLHDCVKVVGRKTESLKRFEILQQWRNTFITKYKILQVENFNPIELLKNANKGTM